MSSSVSPIATASCVAAGLLIACTARDGFWVHQVPADSRDYGESQASGDNTGIGGDHNQPDGASPGDLFGGDGDALPALDTDGDGIDDVDDNDDDNDGVLDVLDPAPRDPTVCGDVDTDSCDDCAIGVDGFGPLPDNDPARDGVDKDGDGVCVLGDPNDSDPGVP